MADETRIVEVVVQAVGDTELKQMAAALQKLATEATASKKAVQDLNKDMNALGTSVDKSAKDINRATKQMGKDLGDIGGGLKKFGALLGTGFTIKGLISGSKDLQELSGHLREVSDAFIHGAMAASGYLDTLNDPATWNAISSLAEKAATSLAKVTKWAPTNLIGNALWNQLGKLVKSEATDQADEAAGRQRHLEALSRGPGTAPMEGVTVSGSMKDAWADYDRAQEALQKQRDEVQLMVADLQQSVKEERALSAAALDGKDAQAKVRDQIAARKELEQITTEIKKAQLDNEQELIDKAAMLLDIRVRTRDIEREQAELMKNVSDDVGQDIEATTSDVEASLQKFADGMGVLDEEIKSSFIDWKESASVLAHAFTQIFSGAIHNARDFFRVVLEGMAEVYMKKAMLAFDGSGGGGGGGKFNWLGAVLGAVGAGLGGIFGGPSMSAAKTGVAGATGTLTTVQPGVAVARGGVFDRGTIQPFALGTILGGPTLFPMARGGIGLAGEAGPEAIMPLKRGADGKLGVAAPKSNVVIENHGAPVTATVEDDGSEMRIILRAARMGADMAVSRVNQSVASGYGSTASSMQRTYGLRRRT